MGKKRVEQNYNNHRQMVPVMHYLLMPLSIVVGLMSIGYTLVKLISGQFTVETIMIFFFGILFMVFIPYSRVFALILQDRAIVTELEVRYFRVTGQWIDPKLSKKQLIALRFASDDELQALCQRALNENLLPNDIKKAIKNWRADYDRV